VCNLYSYKLPDLPGACDGINHHYDRLEMADLEAENKRLRESLAAIVHALESGDPSAYQIAVDALKEADGECNA